jgi:hypothetical protein
LAQGRCLLFSHSFFLLSSIGLLVSNSLFSLSLIGSLGF